MVTLKNDKSMLNYYKFVFLYFTSASIKIFDLLFIDLKTVLCELRAINIHWLILLYFHN